MSDDNPHVYGAGTRLSSAYTAGRDGKPCPKHSSEPTSAARQAWERGRAEYLQTSTRRCLICRTAVPPERLDCPLCNCTKLIDGSTILPGLTPEQELERVLLTLVKHARISFAKTPYRAALMDAKELLAQRGKLLKTTRPDGRVEYRETEGGPTL